MQQVWRADIADIAPGASSSGLTSDVCVQQAVRMAAAVLFLVVIFLIIAVGAFGLLVCQAAVGAVVVLAAAEGGPAAEKCAERKGSSDMRQGRGGASLCLSSSCQCGRRSCSSGRWTCGRKCAERQGSSDLRK